MKFSLAASCVMPVPLAGLGDTVGVGAHCSLRHIKGFCGSNGCKRNLGGTELLLWKWDRQHGLSEQGACVHVCCWCISSGICRLKSGGKAEGCQCCCSKAGQVPFSVSAGVLPGWAHPTAVALPLNHCPWVLLSLDVQRLHGFPVSFTSFLAVCLAFLPCFLFPSLFRCCPNK